MGLLDAFKKKLPLDFNTYILSLSDTARMEVMDNISRFGDPNNILNEMMTTLPCCQTNKLEVRLNKNFLLAYQEAPFGRQQGWYLIKMDSIKYCYFSAYNVIGLILDNDNKIELESSDAVAIYNALKPFVHGFDVCRASPDNSIQLSAWSTNAYYFFDNNALCYRRHAELSSKTIEQVMIENIQDIVWCTQRHSKSGEYDSYELELFFCNGKKPVCIDSNSTYNTFQIALELKKRVPHLLYGPSEEYKQIFKRNPAELMALAKSKIGK